MNLSSDASHSALQFSPLSSPQPSSSQAPEEIIPAKTAVIVPAYNEAGRITNVLRVLSQAALVDEILVVTDGCEDSTADEARGFAALLDQGHGRAIPVRVFELQNNIGKGGAMTYGAHRTEAEVLLFLDADLIGLRSEQVDALLAPMLAEPETRADMSLGLFGAARGGVMGWWLSLCHRTVAAITGQRAIRREVFLAIPGLTRSRFGVETAITRYVKYAWKLRVCEVPLHDVTHPLKEEKIGVFRGLHHRTAMYGEIAAYVFLDTLRQQASARHREQAMEMRQRFSGDKL